LLSLEGVRATFAVGGFGFGNDTVNNGVIFTTLIPWAERGPGQSVQALIGQLFGRVSTITEARVFPVNPPPIQGLGQFGGFQYQLQDRQGSLELDTLVQKMGEMLGAANQNPNLQNVFSTFSAATPQLLVEVDRDRAKSLDVDIDDLFRHPANLSGFPLCE
jgi:HAE1 family hydrophobic/amphiphilic exporter-1